MRAPTTYLAALVAVAAVQGTPRVPNNQTPTNPKPKPKPNLLFMMADQLRAGRSKTP